MRSLHVLALLLAAALAIGAATRADTGAEQEKSGGALLVPADAKVGATPAQLWRALGQTAAEPWKPGVHKSKGLASEVYRVVGPATVVVRTPSGHGSGFVVVDGGWILTNAHCVSMGRTDPATGTQMVQVNVGRFDKGQVQPDNTAFPATVYKKDEDKDLALVKLSSVPAGLKRLELAASPPLPGTDYVVVGHPAAGMLWTPRSCEVINIGMWPEEQIDFAVARLQASNDDDRSRLESLASKMPKLKVLLSSCGLNPGDSGGPLVDKDSRLLGVTFAIPTNNLDKFSYHIHVDEVRAFLQDRPDTPPLHVPDPSPPAVFSMALDLDEDEVPDTLIFGMHPQAPPTGLLVDLDQSFLPNYSEEQYSNEEDIPWDFEFAWQPTPERRAFYDTDDDGAFDLILVDGDENDTVDIGLVRREGAWSRQEERERSVRDPSLVPQEMRARFEKIVAFIRAHEEE